MESQRHCLTRGLSSVRLSNAVSVRVTSRKSKPYENYFVIEREVKHLVEELSLRDWSNISHPATVCGAIRIQAVSGA
jgi:hypothetical protein